MNPLQLFDGSTGCVRTDVDIVIGNSVSHVAYHRSYHRQGDIIFRETPSQARSRKDCLTSPDKTPRGSRCRSILRLLKNIA